jgi:hypothetical protein
LLAVRGIFDDDVLESLACQLVIVMKEIIVLYFGRHSSWLPTNFARLCSVCKVPGNSTTESGGHMLAGAEALTMIDRHERTGAPHAPRRRSPASSSPRIIFVTTTLIGLNT